MNQQYDITVTVGTYNPQWEKLKATLNSIVEQRYVKLQIIVSDDGSDNPLHSEIRAYFSQVGFNDYKLIASEKNQGTVCQFYRSICAADAEYIKPLSPGDLLYDNMVLSKWLDFTKKNNADITFGMAVFYNRKGGKLNVIRHGHKPRNMSIYRRPVSYRDKVINYLCLEDGISGAAKMARKDVLIYYMKFLLNRVIYIEDYFIRLAVLDDRKIMHFPSTVIWYEFGDGGISTTGERKWREPKRKDNLMAYEICLECLDGGITPNAEIRSWLLESIEFRKIISPTFLDKFTHYLKHPYWLVLKIYYKFFGEYSPTNIDDTFFNRCFRNT